MKTIKIPGFIMLGLLSLFSSKKERRAPGSFLSLGYRRGYAVPEYIGVLSGPNGISRLYLSSFRNDSAQSDKTEIDHIIKAKFFRFETLPGGITLHVDPGFSAPGRSNKCFVYKPGKGKVGVDSNFCFEIIGLKENNLN